MHNFTLVIMTKQGEGKAPSVRSGVANGELIDVGVYWQNLWTEKG